jgi:hypothetical protein
MESFGKTAFGHVAYVFVNRLKSSGDDLNFRSGDRGHVGVAQRS